MTSSIPSIRITNSSFSTPITPAKKEPSKAAAIAVRELSRNNLRTNSVNYTEKLLEEVLVNQNGMDFIEKFSNSRSIASLGSTGNEIALLQLDGDNGVQIIEVWNTLNRTKIRTFYPADPEQGETINCIAYGGEIDNGATSIVAVGTSKGNLELWNSLNGEKITVYSASSTAPILEIASLENGLLAIGAGAAITIYDCRSKRELDGFETDAPLTCLTYLGNDLIACGLKDKYSSVNVYDFATQECIFTAGTKPGYTNRCITPLSEEQFLVGNDMGGIYLFDLEDFTVKNVLGFVSPSAMIKISPTEIAAGFYAGVYIVNTQTWKYEIASEIGWQPCGFCLSPDDGSFTTGSAYPIDDETRSGLLQYIPSPSRKVTKEHNLLCRRWRPALNILLRKSKVKH
jgi:WD40 repeat protein